MTRYLIPDSSRNQIIWRLASVAGHPGLSSQGQGAPAMTQQLHPKNIPMKTQWSDPDTSQSKEDVKIKTVDSTYQFSKKGPVCELLFFHQLLCFWRFLSRSNQSLEMLNFAWGQRDHVIRIGFLLTP